MIRAAAYCATRNLYKHLLPAVKSLICNSSVDAVYILAEDEKLPYELPSFCKVIDVSKQTYFTDNGKNWGSRWTYMAMLRVALCKILPQELDRVLSLDVDTIVDENIDAIWELPIGECYFSCAHEWHRTCQEYFYGNVGVCLFNLSKMRDGKADELIRALNYNKFEFLEQDALMLFCQGHIYDMPAKFNQEVYTEKAEKPFIYHHIGNNDMLTQYADVRKYANMPIPKILERRKRENTNCCPDV